MELLGHSQMRTTMDIYSHVMPALAREAADRMGALLLTGKGKQTATQLQPRRPSAQGATKNALLRWVELRGLEPLTPTLPGRHDRVPGGSLQFRKPVDVPVRTTANVGALTRTPRTATTTATTSAP